MRRGGREVGEFRVLLHEERVENVLRSGAAIVDHDHHGATLPERRAAHLDPLSGVGPDQLRIRQLLNRIGERVDGVEITEVIIATDPNTEGEATATYLVRILRDIPGLVISRIASGLPMGGDLEFADELTLGRALSGRRAMV